MEKVIRHRAFPRIIVLICLRAVYSVFFQANITGLVKKKALGVAVADARVSFTPEMGHSYSPVYQGSRPRQGADTSASCHHPNPILQTALTIPVCVENELRHSFWATFA